MRYHKLDGLNNRNLFSQSSGGKTFKIKGVVTPSEGSEGRICFRPLLLACRSPSPLSHGILSVAACVKISPSCKDTDHIRLGPTLTTSL